MEEAAVLCLPAGAQGVDIGVRFRNRMNSEKHVDVNLETSLPYHKLSCTVALIQICRREYGIDSFWSE